MRIRIFNCSGKKPVLSDKFMRCFNGWIIVIAVSLRTLFEMQSSPKDDFGFIFLIKFRILISDISVNFNSCSLGAPRKSLKFDGWGWVWQLGLGPTGGSGCDGWDWVRRFGFCLTGWVRQVGSSPPAMKPQRKMTIDKGKGIYKHIHGHYRFWTELA